MVYQQTLMSLEEKQRVGLNLESLEFNLVLQGKYQEFNRVFQDIKLKHKQELNPVYPRNLNI